MKTEYKYMVATHCFTYNQSLLIEDTLNGFAMQKTSFPVIYTIVDDASTDGEQSVIKKWVKANLASSKGEEIWMKMHFGEIAVARLMKNYNLTFVICLLKDNHYQQGRNKFVYISKWLKCAKYRAVCEGDDYWIDPFKLVKQVAKMESDKSISLCHTCFEILDMKSQEKSIFNDNLVLEIQENHPDEIPSHILGNNEYFISYPTIMFRQSSYNQIKPLLNTNYHFLMGDTQTTACLASVGKTAYIPEVTTVYRIISGSTCHQIDPKKNMEFELSSAAMRAYYSRILEINDDLQKRLNYEYMRLILVYKASFNPSFVPEVPVYYTSRIQKLIFRGLTSKLGVISISIALKAIGRKNK